MTLDQYFATQGALTPAQLCLAASIKNRDQLRQWRYGYGGRKPDAVYCVRIEAATACAVRRWDLRPNDWHRIWPELVGIEGAPAIPTITEEARDAA